MVEEEQVKGEFLTVLRVLVEWNMLVDVLS